MQLPEWLALCRNDHGPAGFRRCADDGRHPEQPQLIDGRFADEHRGTSDARELEREIGHGIAMKYQRECRANRDRREALRRRLVVADGGSF